MIRLTKMLEMLGMDSDVIICEGEEKLYSGTCGDCPKNVWGHAYIDKMEYNTKIFRYIIDVRYM